jgi:hypothetical protein
LELIGQHQDIELHAGNFVMKLLAEQKLSQVDMQAVMSGTDLLIKKKLEDLINEASAQLEESGCSNEQLEILRNLRTNFMNHDMFTNLKTQHSQINFFKKNLGLLMPIKVKLPSKPGTLKRTKSGKQRQAVKEHFIYVPLIDQLQRILNMKDVYSEIKKAKQPTPGVYSRYEDGVRYHKNPLFVAYPDSLQIHVYLDEVQLCNQGGSYDHKVVFVYFSIANLPSKYRSSYQCMNLLSIFEHRQVAKFDYNTLLRPIVDDLKKLEDGIEFYIDGKPQTVRGTLTAFVADNLASHLCGGFKAGFSKGFRKCRFCLAVEEDIQSKFSDCDFIIRSEKDHDEYCASLKIAALNKHIAKLYGILFDSILNELKYFHVIGGLTPDVMHDLLEGVVPLVVSQVVSHCLKKKYFKLDELNQIIQDFNYGVAESRDKPSPITLKQLKKKNIRGSATQRWLLAVNLPLMIGAKVKRGDIVWACFGNLLKICRIVFSECATNLDIMNLSCFIFEFLTGYKECFKRKLTYKMHNIVHYPRFIQEYGPLGSIWTMRFEAKHAQFKSIHRRTRNLKNAPFTLAYRHQQWMANRYNMCNGSLLAFNITSSPKKFSCTLANLFYGGQVAALLGLDTLSNSVNLVPWVKIGSTYFKENESVLLCTLQSDITAQFGLLVRIICDGDRYVFVCKLYRTKKFDSHLQSFRVTERSDDFHVVFPHTDLEDFRVYSFHVPGFMRPDAVMFDKFVIPKTNILNSTL